MLSEGKRSRSDLPSCVAPELVKVLERVAAAHWMECQPEGQNLLGAPTDNEEETRVHQTWNNRGPDTKLQSVMSYNRSINWFFFLENSFLDS